MYYNFLLVVTLFVYIQSTKTWIEDSGNLKAKANLGVFLMIFIIFYMGLRPMSGYYFGDMRNYANYFEEYASGEPVDLEKDKDWLFEYFMKFCSGIMNIDSFFTVCAALYIIPLLVFTKKVFKEYWFYGFFMIVISMSFWAYGTNGIRNGLATSFFLLGISRQKMMYRMLWMLIAVSFHKSMLIPIAAYLMTTYFTNPKYYLRAWLAAIPISFALGSFFELWFASIEMFQETRLDTYLVEDGLEDIVLKIGFRWDFLIYSSTGVVAGYYFIIKKQYEDPLYIQLFNMYLVANTVWILIIRANFSNRFAFLSWFMLGIIIIYPLLKLQFFKNQHLVIGKIILGYFLLSYVLNVILTSL